MEDKQTVTVNRMYKDRLFRLIFNDKKRLLDLYNAMNGTTYSEEERLEIVTLDNAIYLNMKNDVSFLLSDTLNMYEHQSTVNPNIVLRSLFYCAESLKVYLANENLYSKKKIRIPVPIFVVFYNGKQEQPERKTLKLSDSFEQKREDAGIEMTVRFININKGYNLELIELCEALKGYAVFVALVRENEKQMMLEEAVEKAIDECIEQDLLREFFIKQRAEVIEVFLYEYDEEKVMRMLAEEAKEDGWNEGLEQGLEQGVEQGARYHCLKIVKKMLSQGRSWEEITELTELTEAEWNE